MKRVVFIIVGLITLIAIPATVFLSMRSQELRKRAAPATNIALSPASVTKAPNEEFTLEARLDTGDNQVVAAQINIVYDPTKLEALTITNGTLFPNILSSGVVGNGTASIAVGAANTTTPIHGTGTAAVIKFKALSSTTSPVSVRFANDTYVGALGEGNVNVLIGTAPTTVTITGGGSSNNINAVPTPTIAPAIITFGGTAGFTYTPVSTTAKVGQPIIWRGDFATHPLESTNGLWTKVQSGTEFTHTFTTAGTYTYFCQAHGNATSGMKGQIVITADGASQSTITPILTPTLTPTQSATDSASSSAVTIKTPSVNESVSTNQPTITGKAPAGSIVTIVIHSSEQITATVTADANGNWTYTVTQPISSGPHTIVVAAKDPTTNQTNTATIAFVVASGSENGSSGDAIPATGAVENTFLLLGLGVIFIFAGSFIPLLHRRSL